MYTFLITYYLLGIFIIKYYRFDIFHVINNFNIKYNYFKKKKHTLIVKVKIKSFNAVSQSHASVNRFLKFKNE